MITGIAAIDDEMAAYQRASDSLETALTAAAALTADDGPAEAEALGHLQRAQAAVDAAAAAAAAARRRGDIRAATDAQRQEADARAALRATLTEITPVLREITGRRLAVLSFVIGQAQATWLAAGEAYAAVSELGVDERIAADDPRSS